MNTSANNVGASIVSRSPRIGLAWQIVIGLVVGVLVGFVLSRYPDLKGAAIKEYLQPAGDLFVLGRRVLFGGAALEWVLR